MSDQAKSQKWQRRKDARPAELLDAALAEFFEKGFAAARLEDIAQRAGVSKGTVYLYFDSKDDMFEALLRAIPQANVEQLQAVAADSSVPAEVMLARVLSAIGGFLRDERMSKFPRLVIGEAGRFPKLAETYKREVISRGIGVLAALIERGIAEGSFRDVDAKAAAYTAMSGLLFVALWRTTFERFDDEPLDVERFVTQHIDTFLRGIKR
jgi:AcrR family transcriptional regulator